MLDEARIYTDDGVSGALFANRAEFQRMMRDAAAGLFEAVVFYDLDRFGRNARHTMSALNTLADLGVSIWDYSTGLAVDLDSFEGETMTFSLNAARSDPRCCSRAGAPEGHAGSSDPLGSRRAVC